MSPPLAELAHHFSAGNVVSGCGEKAIDYAQRAAERELDQLAYELSASHYSAALDALEARPPVELQRRCELLLGLAEARYRGGAVGDAEEISWEAIEVARKIGAVELFARACEQLAYRRVGNDGTVPEHRVAVLEEALVSLGDEDSALRARVLAGLSADLYWEDLERSEALSREAVALARRVGSIDTLQVALDQRYDLLFPPEHSREREEITLERLELALESGDLESEFYARKHRFSGLVTRVHLGMQGIDAGHVDAAGVGRLRPIVDGAVQVDHDSLADDAGIGAELEGLGEAEALFVEGDALRDVLDDEHGNGLGQCDLAHVTPPF